MLHTRVKVQPVQVRQSQVRMRPVLVIAAAVACAATSAHADPTGAKQVVDVTWYYSGGSWDAAIHAAIADASVASARNCKGAIVYFPEGEYLVNGTIDLSGIPSNINIVGAGGSPFPDPPRHAPDSCPIGPNPSKEIVTIIKATQGSGPLFRLAGFATTFTDLTLEGPDGEDSVTLVQTGAINGRCTSTVTFRGVYFRNADIGIALGLPSDNEAICNSEVSLDRVSFVSCRTGLQTNTIQAGNIHCHQTGAIACKSAFDFHDGPINFSFNTGTFTGCGGEGDNEWIFNFRGGGPNNGNAKITNAHFDADRSNKANPHGVPCRQFLRLAGDHLVTLETSIQNNAIAGLTRPFSPYEAYWPVIEVLAGNLTVSNCRFHSFPILRIKNTPIDLPYLTKSIRFRDCAFPIPAPPQPPGAPFNFAGLFIDAQVTPETFGLLFDSCSRKSFTPIPRWTNVVDW